MINRTTKAKVWLTGSALNEAIRSSLAQASDALIDSYGLRHVDLRAVTTKSYMDIAFSKFVCLGVLKSYIPLNEKYIENAFEISQGTSFGQAEFEAFMVKLDDPDLYYKKTYSTFVRRGLGLFLLSLHSKRAITLPMSFAWPSARHSQESTLASRLVCEQSEILSFIRSVETQSALPQDSAFSVLRDKKRTEWFATYATKVVLACGWHCPDEITLDHLSDTYMSQSAGEEKELQGVSVFATLIEVLGAKFGDRLEPRLRDKGEWSRRISMIRASKHVDGKAARKYKRASTPDVDMLQGDLKGPVIGLPNNAGSLTVDEHFLGLARCPPALAHTDRLPKQIEKATGDFDFKENLNYWVELQEIYLDQQRESQKGVRAALGMFNLYLFYYLPFWYMRNESSTPFPSTPNKLIGSVFVSRLLKPKTNLPRTLTEFMKERARVSKLENSSYYAALKQIESFFKFIIRNSHKLDYAEKFIQPLSPEDYPSSPKSLGTNKYPMPRRLLGLFISYVEAFRTYVQHVTDLCINGSLANKEMERVAKLSGHVDTFVNAAAVGFVPIIFLNGQTVPIRWLPGFPKVDYRKLIDGRTVLIPHPHAINQVAVSLYTGLRHNHIQWLDAEKFDSLVQSMLGEYTTLLVNTDKAQKKPIRPQVNVQVIRILRDQLRWRNSVDEYHFKTLHWYNNNDKTSYPKFLPLFAYDLNGDPHPDDAYRKAWRDSLLGFQSFLYEHADLIGGPIPEFCKLRPLDIAFHDNRADEKYKKYADSEANFVALKVATEITPHSSRVSVVSELIRFLPAALIGSNVTGQTEGTVYHYVVDDEEEIKRDQTHQAMHLRDKARHQHMDIVAGQNLDDRVPHLKADEINSNLAKSLRINITETFARYGCISLAIGEMATGVDILEEIGIGRAAFNKTEICPYGNNCPSEIVKELRGLRRCAICPYAIRSIDHLPAICVKQKQSNEALSTLDSKITCALSTDSMSPDEIDALEAERQRAGEELAGWELCIEVLEQTRRRLALGDVSRRWVVERPEILIKQLERVSASNSDADYLLARLAECTSYPGFQSEKISRQFDLLRRKILSTSGASLDEILSLDHPIDSAAECAGLIRTVVAANRLTLTDISNLLTSDAHLSQVPKRTTLKIAYA